MLLCFRVHVLNILYVNITCAVEPRIKTTYSSDQSGLNFEVVLILKQRQTEV